MCIATYTIVHCYVYTIVHCVCCQNSADILCYNSETSVTTISQLQSYVIGKGLWLAAIFKENSFRVWLGISCSIEGWIRFPMSLLVYCPVFPWLLPILLAASTECDSLFNWPQSWPVWTCHSTSSLWFPSHSSSQTLQWPVWWMMLLMLLWGPLK